MLPGTAPEITAALETSAAMFERDWRLAGPGSPAGSEGEE